MKEIFKPLIVTLLFINIFFVVLVLNNNQEVVANECYKTRDFIERNNKDLKEYKQICYSQREEIETMRNMMNGYIVAYKYMKDKYEPNSR